MTVSIQDMLALLVAFQSFLFSGFLWSRRGSLFASHRFLASFIFLIGLHFLNMFLMETHVLILNLSGCFASFYAPLLYLYVRSIVEPHWRPGFRILFHGLPLTFSILWTIQDYRAKLAGDQVSSWITPLILMQMAIYLIFSVRFFKRYRLIVLHTRSSLDRFRARMVYFLLFMFLVMMVGVSLEFLFSNLGRPQLQAIMVFVIFGNMLALVTGCLWMGLQQPDVFQAFAHDEIRLAQDERQKYRASSLTAEDADRHQKTLLAYMKDSKPYLDPNLKLMDLAEALAIPMKHLSQVINQRFHKNFFDFINAYRIEEVKARIVENPVGAQTVLDIMLDSGFQSKSSFNKAFKKHTGTTPSHFRKKEAARNR